MPAPPAGDATASVGDAQGKPEQAAPLPPVPEAPAVTAAPPPPPAAAPATGADAHAGPATQTCPNCGATLPANARFCLECGTKIEQKPAMVRPTHCVNCGAELPANAKFCLECGTKVELVPATGGGMQGQPAAAASSSTAGTMGSADSVGSVSGGVGAPPQPAPSVAPPDSTVIPAAGGVVEAPAAPPPAVQVPPSPAPVPAGPTSSGPRLVASDGTIVPVKQQPDLVVGREDPISGIHPDIDLTTQGGEAGGVSRRHATMHFQGGQWSVIDLDSTNYTRVNGNRIAPNTPTPLKDGDKLQFGRLQFEFKI